LPPGTVVGRYKVVAALGRGAMGVVVRAHDPQLGRDVALKLVRSAAQHDDPGAVRLMREAQALAQLSHPNVVAVHDVGAFEGQVFLAMEMVRGETLSRWLDRGRPWREIVAVFLDAGRGLAAAHGAGLVHRDFKPGNVIVGDDRRARVLDFGLARSSGGGSLSDELESSSTSSPDLRSGDDSSGAALLATQLTQAGAIIGTPRYMAPEQLRGEAIDARADQFAFCVALYQALYGIAPYAEGAADRQELLARIDRGVVAPPRRGYGRGVPTRLRQALTRGLRGPPGERHTSMAPLLLALEGSLRSRAAAWGAAGAGAAVLASIIAIVATSRTPAAAPCAGAGAAGPLATPALRAQLAAAMATSGRGNAEETLARAFPLLERFDRAWPKARFEVCAATRARGEQSEQLMDLRMACLDDRRRLTQGLVDVWLRGGDGVVLDHAVEAAMETTALGACDPARVLADRRADLDAAAQDREAVVARRLAEADMLRRAGKPDDALAVVRSASRRAQTGPSRALARVRLAEAELLAEQGHYEEADVVLDQAFAVAGVAGDDETLARGYVLSISQRVYWKPRLDEALGMRVVAEALVAKSGPRAESWRLELLKVLGRAYLEKGDNGQARLVYQQAADLARAQFGARDPQYGRALSALGGPLYYLGDYDQALAVLGEASEILVEAFGPNHPDVASALASRAVVHGDRGDTALAEPLARRALAIRKLSLGSENPLTVIALQNLAGILLAAGRLDECRPMMIEALAAAERIYGPVHMELTWNLRDLGELEYRLGHGKDALAHLNRALAIRERERGRDHPEVAVVLLTRGPVRCSGGDGAGGRADAERSVTILEHAGPNHPYLVPAKLSLGRCLLASGQARAAIRVLDEAKALAGEAPVRGEIDLVLAEASWRSGDRVGARAAARAALEVLRAQASSLQQDAERWLREHDPSFAPGPRR
jgi:tetratricopeptide (TPR) repeat protein